MSSYSMRLSDIRGRREEAAVGAARTASARVPADIMLPRIIFVSLAGALVLFGLVMIYSSSSIMGLTSKQYGHDPMYFLVRQGGFAGVGVVAAIALAKLDYHVFRGGLLKAIWVGMVASLAVVYSSLAGQDAYGASRWIAIGPFTLQPSEFAKAIIVLVGARIGEKYYEGELNDTTEVAKLLLLGIGLPLLLIFFQPDKGTTGVVLLTLLVMAYLAGIPGRYVAIVGVVGIAIATAYAFKDDYSRARILTMLDPFRDPYGSGYQLTQGFYALGSGGLTGVGLGFSRQKYNYLPMAHNDFIVAVVGEELGFVGVACLLVAFAALLWAGFKIAENAPDMTGRLIASGSTSLILIQLLLNVSGVVGIFPLSGKPVPFVSYGGSSVISSLVLVGMVVSVSMRSTLPQTGHDRMRAELRLAPDVEEDGVQGSQAGEVTPRSARLTNARSGLSRQGFPQPYLGRQSGQQVAGGAGRPPMRLYEGGVRLAGTRADEGTDALGRRKRIDLGPSAADRLRGTRGGDRRSR